MKRKKGVFISLLILSLAIVCAVFLLRNSLLTKQAIGSLMGIASALIGLSVSQLLVLRMEETDPRLQKQNEIERTDERNIAIRRRAKAMSGDVLQWAIIAASWVSIGFGGPIWVTLAAVMAFVLKSLLDICLMARYQREM